MNRIEIRGVIVPSNYDVEWMKPYIEKGLISPESYIRSAIAAADTSKPLSIYINSPGGSVFAAYEIINTLVEWRAENKQPVEITIGAMAASAASAIAVLSGASVKVHRNSKLMFHGAWTVSIGGKELHEDTADLLDRINADIKARLVSKYGIDAETVDEWFAEGREGWLSAEEAGGYGIANGGIIDVDDDPVEFDQGDIAQIEENGMAIAALLQNVEPENSEDLPDDGEPAESTEGAEAGDPDADDGAAGDDTVDAEVDDGEPGDETGEPEQTAEPEPEQTAEPEAVDVEALVQAQVAERVEIEIGNRTEELVAQLTDLQAAVAQRDAALKEFQSKHDKAVAAHAKAVDEFEQRIVKLTTALEQANARASKLLAGSLTFSPEITSWPEALQACDGDYAKAAKQYPELARNYKLPR